MIIIQLKDLHALILFNLYYNFSMEVFNTLDKNLDLKNISLALGFFDGVHRGHQEVILSAKNITNSKSAVVTFKKHPLEILGYKCEYITSTSKRAKLIEQLGIDYLFELEFTLDIAKMSGEDYINHLVNYFKPAHITTGFNHTFGRNKSAGVQTLEEFQNKYNYKYTQIPPQRLDNEVISSTKIREYLSKGDIKMANAMLGYNFQLSGTVVEGLNLGTKIGFPTANINYPNAIVKIPYGVYSSKVNGLKSITNYGEKPTVSDAKIPVVESHILNFDKQMYNENIEIDFVKRIRDEKKFKSIDELKAQINEDIKNA